MMEAPKLPCSAKLFVRLISDASAALALHLAAVPGRTRGLADECELDQLLQFDARLTETTLVLSALRDGDRLLVDSRRIGPSLIFERCRAKPAAAVIERLLASASFTRRSGRASPACSPAVHSGSDRACDKWLEGYRIAGLDGIDLHHLYRAIAWLGEELAAQETYQAVAGDQGPGGGAAVRATTRPVQRSRPGVLRYPPPSTSTARVARSSDGAASPRITARN